MRYTANFEGKSYRKVGILEIDKGFEGGCPVDNGISVVTKFLSEALRPKGRGFCRSAVLRSPERNILLSNKAGIGAIFATTRYRVIARSIWQRQLPTILPLGLTGFITLLLAGLILS